jgi:hypothetical protein
VKRAARTGLADKLIDRIVDDDLPCGAKPFRALSDAEFADAMSTALERHHALNWLCGDDRDWDKIRTDT